MSPIYLSYIKTTKEQKRRSNQSCFNCIHRIPDMNTCFDGDGIPYRWICELTRHSASDPDPCKYYERSEEKEKNKNE